MTKEECEVETSKAIMEMRRHIAELEQENAELKQDKKDLIFIRDQRAACMCEDKQRLTEAKEIIRELVRVEYADFTNGDYSNELSKVLEQAEQFLKEVESTDIREDSTLDGDWVVDDH